MTSTNAGHGVYRPDIDGLRAFAVLSVVVFHAFPTLLPGGFVGVDVFFVISGFLISGIMFTELAQGQFKFSAFYARRIKRIFPALLVVLLCCFAFAWVVLFNDELKQLGNHVLRAAVFLSNFILWHESGYFDNAAETKPLLHLWSLGIEEQFYILWPLMIWALWRTRSLRMSWISAFALCSLAWNLYQSQHDVVHDFFSPFTRFWELMFGALLAYGQVLGGDKWQRHTLWTRGASWRSALGMTLLIGSVVGISDTQHFPGAWALLPVLGAVLVISAGPHAWVNRSWLANPAMIGLGLISYPLYLWHWPIFSFLRIIEGATPAANIRFAALVLSVLFAGLTFRFIERPLRFKWQSPFKTATLVIGMIGVGCLGYATNKSDGFPARDVMNAQRVVNAGDIGHDDFHAYYQKKFSVCDEPSIKNGSGVWKGMVRCFQTKAHTPVDFVLIGDSHAEHLFLGLAEALPEVNVAFYGRNGMPLSSEKSYGEIYSYVLNEPSIQTVVLSAMWTERLAELPKGLNFRDELDQTVKALLAKGKVVYLANDLPKFDFDPQRCKFMRPFAGGSKCDQPLVTYQQRQQRYMNDLVEIKNRNIKLQLLDVSQLMCGKQTCSMAQNGQLFYRDNNHLNILGSQYVAVQLLSRYPALGDIK